MTSLLFPFVSNNKALEPARKGVAILVPLSTPYAPSLRGRVLRMLPPGAATAGLKYMSVVGP